nr:hypothetical protein [Rhodococcus sp. ENV425]
MPQLAQVAEGGFERLRAEAGAVHHEPGAAVWRKLRPPLADALDQSGARRGSGGTVDQERHPARQERVLHRRDGGIAVVHQLHGVGGNRIALPCPRRARHDKDLPIPRRRAIEFAEHKLDPSGGVGSGRETGIHPDRFAAGCR